MQKVDGVDVKYLLVIVDTNDADFETSFAPIDECTLLQITPLIEVIKEFKPYDGVSLGTRAFFRHEHNFPYGEYHPREDLGEKFPQDIYPGMDDEIEVFLEFCPSDFHSIVHVAVIEVASRENLFSNSRYTGWGF